MNKFSMFMKHGGGDCHFLDEYFKKIQFIFKELSTKEYSKEIEQFHIELRVDGDYLTFGDEEGCNHLKYFKKRHLIANSISFVKSIYSNKDILSVFIKNNMVVAFEQFIKRLEKDKVRINGELLMNDLKKYINENI